MCRRAVVQWCPEIDDTSCQYVGFIGSQRCCRAHPSAPVTLKLALQGSCVTSRLHWSKIAEAEAAVSVNDKKWLVMHMHVQLKLDELRGPAKQSKSFMQSSTVIIGAGVLAGVLHQLGWCLVRLPY
jgi:hypothetical protein